MGQLIRPSSVTVVSDNNGRTHMVITLELNINLNSNGLSASVGAAEEEKPKVKEKPKEEEFSGFEIPEFSSTEQIKFGKRVDAK